MAAHTILVAFCVTGCESAEQAQLELMRRLPAPEWAPPGCSAVIDCWWIAKDDRHDGSDNDSAVFVDMGQEKRANAILQAAGLQH